jgi:molybdopterin adenylyltransferase
MTMVKMMTLARNIPMPATRDPAELTLPEPFPSRAHPDELIVGLVSISDRASSGVYQDKGLPELEAWLQGALQSAWRVERRLIADDAPTISATLIELVDQRGCDLVLTTGGTGPAWRDVTPEATLAVATKEMPGFGEQMRQISLHFVPTAILSRQVAVIRETSAQVGAIPTSTVSTTVALPLERASATTTAVMSTSKPRHAALIVNLPGQPKSIRETLEGARDSAGTLTVPGIFAAIPYCIDLIGGPYIETVTAVVDAFRPKAARRPPTAG